MWPFKKKKKKEAAKLPAADPYVYAKRDGKLVELKAAKLVCADGTVYVCRAPMIYVGQEFKQGQVIGKK